MEQMQDLRVQSLTCCSKTTIIITNKHKHHNELMHKDCKLEREEIEQLTNFTIVPLETFKQLYVSDM